MTVTYYTRETAPHLPPLGSLGKYHRAIADCQRCQEHFADPVKNPACGDARCAACYWDEPEETAARAKRRQAVKRALSKPLPPLPHPNPPRPLFPKGFDEHAVVFPKGTLYPRCSTCGKFAPGAHQWHAPQDPVDPLYETIGEYESRLKAKEATS